MGKEKMYTPTVDEFLPTQSRSQSNFGREISESEKRARKLLMDDSADEDLENTNEQDIQHLLDSSAQNQQELNELTIKNQEKIEALRRQQQELHQEEMRLAEMEKNQ